MHKFVSEHSSSFDQRCNKKQQQYFDANFIEVCSRCPVHDKLEFQVMNYRKVSNIRRTKSQNVNDSRLTL